MDPVMTILAMFLVMTAYKVYLASKLGRTRRDAMNQRFAVFLDCDMSDALHDMWDDPTMTKERWQKLLPLFEAADQIVRSKTNLPIGRNAEFIRAKLAA